MNRSLNISGSLNLNGSLNSSGNDFESVLNANNNSINSHSRAELADNWFRRSKIDRSLFGDLGVVEQEEICLPKIPASDATVILSRKYLRLLKKTYNLPQYTIENIKSFFGLLENIIRVSDGEILHNNVWVKSSVCSYTSSAISALVGSDGIKLFCKMRSLDPRTQKYIDIISNSIVLFITKVSRANPELLSNNTFSDVIIDFADLLARLYYFVGSKYSGTRLCNRFNSLVQNINSIFYRIHAYNIILQTGQDGKFMCGHGVLPIKTEDGKSVVAIHEGKTDGSIESESLLAKRYKLLGGSRKKRNMRKNTKTRKH